MAADKHTGGENDGKSAWRAGGCAVPHSDAADQTFGYFGSALSTALRNALVLIEAPDTVSIPSF